jgi:hypothetical protein
MILRSFGFARHLSICFTNRRSMELTRFASEAHVSVWSATHSIIAITQTSRHLHLVPVVHHNKFGR